MAWRNKRSTLLRILSPSIFILLVLLLDYAIRADVNASEEFRELRTPKRNAVNEIPKCESDIYIKAPCFDFFYSPSTSSRVKVNSQPNINIKLDKLARVSTCVRIVKSRLLAGHS